MLFRFPAALSILAFAGALAGCTRAPQVGAGSTPRAHAWTQPGVLRIEMTSLPNTLNPALRTQYAETFITRFVFDPLVETRPDGTIVPKLARSVPTTANGGISRDGKTITYRLRPGLRWHDGVPLTSADVRFTAAAYMDSHNNVSIRDGFDRVARIDTPDPLTAVVHLAAPYTPFVRQFETQGRVLPAHAFAHPGALNLAPFNAAPIGSGPFKFVRWARGDRVELVANEAYYLGRPKLKRIVVRFVPNDSTAINALVTHEADWLWNASPFAFRRLRSVATLHVASLQANGTHGLELNMTRPPLDDVRVRRAISYAVDRDALVRNVAFGATTPADADLPTFMRPRLDVRSAQRFDPALARNGLDAAGWRLQNGGRVKAGNALAFTIVYPAGNGTAAVEIVQIQAMLRAVGIGVDTKSFDPNQLFAPAQMGGILESGKFDIDLSGYYETDDPRRLGALLVRQSRAARFQRRALLQPRLRSVDGAGDRYARRTRTWPDLRTHRANPRNRRAVGIHLVAATDPHLRHRFQRLRNRTRPPIARPASMVDRNVTMVHVRYGNSSNRRRVPVVTDEVGFLPMPAAHARMVP